MKTLFKIKRLLVLVISMAVCTLAFEIESRTMVPFEKTDFPDDHPKDEPEYGHRMPQRNLIGYIDIDSYSVILPEFITEKPISYVISKDGTCIFVSSSEEEFVYSLDKLGTEDTIIIIYFTDFYLTGYYSPEQ